MGPRWRLSHCQEHYRNALFAFTTHKVTLASLRPNGRVRRPADLGALRTARGLGYAFNGRQVGLLAGLDWLSHRAQVARRWRY